MKNPNKAKLFIFLAIILIIGLIVFNVILVVSIHSKNKTIADQQSTIAKQEQILSYYNK